MDLQLSFDWCFIYSNELIIVQCDICTVFVQFKSFRWILFFDIVLSDRQFLCTSITRRIGNDRCDFTVFFISDSFVIGCGNIRSGINSIFCICIGCICPKVFQDTSFVQFQIDRFFCIIHTSKIDLCRFSRCFFCFCCCIFIMPYICFDLFCRPRMCLGSLILNDPLQ